MVSDYLFKLLHIVFAGFLVSFLYGGITSLAVWIYEPEWLARYIDSYVISYNCLVSGGLILGTGLFVLLSQRSIPRLIESNFDAAALAETRYEHFKRRFGRVSEASAFSATYAFIAFGIFSLCQFPLSDLPRGFLISYACAQYAVGVFVGRQIFFIAHMLRSISGIRITRNMVESDIAQVAGYVNIVSTMTVMAVYFHVTGFYYGKFNFVQPFGESARMFLLLPVLIAVPVIVVFNFYPRAVLRHLYDRSNKQLETALAEDLSSDHLSEFARRSLEIEYDRLRQAAAKGQLELSLSDIPMAITIVAALIGLLSNL